MRSLRCIFNFLFGVGQQGNARTRRPASPVDPPPLQMIPRDSEGSGEEPASDDSSSVDPTPPQAARAFLRRSVDSASEDAESTVRRRRDTAGEEQDVVAPVTKKELDQPRELKKPGRLGGNGDLGEFGSSVDQMSFHFNTKQREREPEAAANRVKEENKMKQDYDPTGTAEVKEQSPKKPVSSGKIVTRSPSRPSTSEGAVTPVKAAGTVTPEKAPEFTPEKSPDRKYQAASSPSKNRTPPKKGEGLQGILSSPEKKSKSPPHDKRVHFDEKVKLRYVPKISLDAEDEKAGSNPSEEEIQAQGKLSEENIIESVHNLSRQQEVFGPNSARAEQLGPSSDQRLSGSAYSTELGIHHSKHIVKTSPKKQFIVSKVPQSELESSRSPEPLTPEKTHPHHDQTSQTQSDANKQPRSPGQKHKISPCHYTSPDTLSLPPNFHFTEFPIKDNEIGTSPPMKKPCFAEEERQQIRKLDSQEQKDEQSAKDTQEVWLDNNRPPKGDESEPLLEKEHHHLEEKLPKDSPSIHVADVPPSATGENVSTGQETSQATAHSKEVDATPEKKFDVTNPQLESFDVVVKKFDVNRFRGYHQFNDF